MERRGHPSLAIIRDGPVPMRTLLFILLAVWVLVSACWGGRVLIIQLELPPDLVPYYEWLLTYPGLDQPSQDTQPDRSIPYPTSNL
jgi:hypothetical protein